MKKNLLYALVGASLIATGSAYAESVRVTVTIENLAPQNGTFQTPHWVGFHDGTFDLYNGGTPASSLPVPGSVAIERLAEDGNNADLAADFVSLQPDGVDATIPGPNGPIGPGEIASQSFVLDSTNIANRYFSYGSMVLPSNDFWYANGNPLAHPVFDELGNFIAQDFFVTQQDLLDAGTEVNDEIPANTAFFGQAAGNTGEDENGVILDFGDASGLVQFRQPEDGGNILADPRFAMADFAVDGYPVVKISFNATPVVEGPLVFSTRLSGSEEVPPVATRAFGFAAYSLNELGDELRFRNIFLRLRNITMAHLHLGAVGENGPVVASLLPADFDPSNLRQVRRLSRFISGTLTAADLVGPFAGQPLDVLSAAIKEGNIYINIHTEANPSGELRGQLSLY